MMISDDGKPVDVMEYFRKEFDRREQVRAMNRLAEAMEGRAATAERTRKRRGAPHKTELKPEDLATLKRAHEMRARGDSWATINRRLQVDRKTLLRWERLAPIGEEIRLSRP